MDAVDRIANEIERKTGSKQPRLDKATFGAMIEWLRIAEIEQVPYSADSRNRDAWLRKLWKLQPHLAGVVNTVTLIDANRGWELVGGRNQVGRYTRIMHNAEGGWRQFSRRASLGFWTTDMGCVVETARDGIGGPLRALYNVDSARCRLTGDPDRPLEYYPAGYGGQTWRADDFFRVCSMPNDDEAFRGLGFCAVSRAVEICRLFYAVMTHDQEQVGARAPKGLLLLHNISEEQWEQSLLARNADMESMERRYYGGVQVLASAGMDQADAKIVALSQLPANFDSKTFVDLSMYAYALCFGYDPSEFWPVQFGSLGRGTEAETQHMKASGKGGLDFALAFQEQLQLELPETLHFEFEQRDDAGALADADVQSAKLNVVRMAYESGLTQGAPLLSREEARTLLVDAGLIPPEWTMTEEDVTTTDTDDSDLDSEEESTEEALDTERVQRAMQRFPSEPIVRYSWPSGKLRTIWKPRVTPRFHMVTRADDSGVLYDKNGVKITEEDVDKAVSEARRRVGAEFAQILEAPTATPEMIAKWGA